MLLASILITSDDGGRKSLPSTLQQNIRSLKHHHPHLPHRMFGQEEVIELIRDKFPKEVLDSYLALRPFAYRADLARYCILYEFGGVYADVAYYFLSPLPLDQGKAVVFRGNLVSSPWDTSNGIIFMSAKHKAMERAIELVCANVKRRYYGPTSLCPTGPVVFGRALAETCDPEELITGRAMLLKRERVASLAPDLVIPRGERIHCQAIEDTLVAVKRKRITGSGLSPFGIKAGNSYWDLWEAREVYSEA